MTKSPSPRPLSVKVIVILLGLQAASYFLTMDQSILFLTRFNLYGPPIIVYKLFFIPFCIYIAIGLWRLNNTARKAAIGYAGYKILDGFLSIVYFLIYGMPAYHDAPDVIFMYIWLGGYACVCLVEATIIWFLIKRKSAFVKPAHD